MRAYRIDCPQFKIMLVLDERACKAKERKLTELAQKYGAVTFISGVAGVAGFVYPEGAEIPHFMRVLKGRVSLDGHTGRFLLAVPDVGEPMGLKVRKLMDKHGEVVDHPLHALRMIHPDLVVTAVSGFQARCTEVVKKDDQWYAIVPGDIEYDAPTIVEVPYHDLILSVT